MTANRRDFLKNAAAGTLLATAGTPPISATATGADRPSGTKPNMILFVADELRWDFIGAARANPSVKTPNIDKLAARGTMFTHAVTNQPLCSPARACMMTGRYPTEAGVWKLELDLRQDLPTVASELRRQGYTANFLGKWHLAKAAPHDKSGLGWVAPEHRGGFLDFWEGANVLELTSHPYSGTIWNSAGKEITWQDEYRVDFMTDRAVRFLEQPRDKPFLLFVSQLEPHFQNDLNRVVGPDGWAARYQDPYVPGDLQPLPGSWQRELPDYYAAVESIDQSVGRIVATLEKQNILRDTIFVFTSDHGCHFRTREDNYKRTPHDSSIRIPLVIAGPGVPPGRRVEALAGNVHLTPTMLDLCGVPVPSSMKGRSLVPVMTSPQAEAAWAARELIQISQGNGDSIGRAIRTQQWTYSIANPTGGSSSPSAASYAEYVMFNNAGDPHQLINLAGRPQYKDQASELRKQLLELVELSGDPAPQISPARLLQP